MILKNHHKKIIKIKALNYFLQSFIMILSIKNCKKYKNRNAKNTVNLLKEKEKIQFRKKKKKIYLPNYISKVLEIIRLIEIVL